MCHVLGLSTGTLNFFALRPRPLILHLCLSLTVLLSVSLCMYVHLCVCVFVRVFVSLIPLAHCTINVDNSCCNYLYAVATATTTDTLLH